MGIVGQVLDDHQFQFAQLHVRLFVMLRERLDVIVADGLSVQEGFHIGEEGLLFVLHVAADLLGIFIVKLHDKHA